MSNMPTIDEFPNELAELLDLMTKLSVSDELTERVVEEAIATELLYKFGRQAITEKLQWQMKMQIQAWCDIVFALTGRALDLEAFELK